MCPVAAELPAAAEEPPDEESLADDEPPAVAVLCAVDAVVSQSEELVLKFSEEPAQRSKPPAKPRLI